MGRVGRYVHQQAGNADVKGSRLLVPSTLHTCYNDQGHKFACNNHHQPHLEHYQVKARTEATQHHLEKFDDLFLKDQIWAAREIWSRRVRAVKMTPFQEALLTQGLVECQNRPRQQAY